MNALKICSDTKKEENIKELFMHYSKGYVRLLLDKVPIALFMDEDLQLYVIKCRYKRVTHDCALGWKENDVYAVKNMVTDYDYTLIDEDSRTSLSLLVNLNKSMFKETEKYIRKNIIFTRRDLIEHWKE